MTWKESFLDILSWPFKLTIYAMMYTVAFLPVYRIYFWLKEGHWLSCTLSDALTYIGFAIPMTSIQWIGVRRLVSGFIDLPFEIAFAFILITGFLIALFVASEIGSRKAR